MCTSYNTDLCQLEQNNLLMTKFFRQTNIPASRLQWCQVKCCVCYVFSAQWLNNFLFYSHATHQPWHSHNFDLHLLLVSDIISLTVIFVPSKVTWVYSERHNSQTICHISWQHQTVNRALFNEEPNKCKWHIKGNYTL